jgi:hypothetical protein
MTATRPGCAAAIVAAAAVAAGARGLDCPSDVDGSGAVEFGDLLAVIAAWGPCPGCPADVDSDDVVGFLDLLLVLGRWGPCPGDPRPLELAGNALAAYPHVEFVKAFLEGASVTIAIDPADVPGGDATADVYVTVARTDAQWSNDPSLADVRGGAQTVTFAGATIGANAFTLDHSDELSGDAGAGLGVGYDVVCDFNRNGRLDDADAIDGLGSEAGFYVVADLTLPGPLTVTTIDYEVWGVTPGFESQRAYFPSAIATMGKLPLVQISHGNGHSYQWYDYLGAHLASYGFIVIAHENNTMPGIETASTSTFEHTDAFLGQLDTIGAGVLDGHVDASTIAWIGHSRGGEGVVRAYTRLHDGLVATAHYTAQDVVLVSSIAPNNALGPGITEPLGVSYHLLWGSADGDITGSGVSVGTWSFAIFERASGFRQSTYVHGADHNDFNCCGFDDFVGPPETEIGRPEAQRVAKATYLALLERYARGNVPALDYLWRQWERFKPHGVSPGTVVVNDYREPADRGGFVIDDFETNPALDLSSSGGSVALDVQNPFEGLMRDGGDGYHWTGAEPMNGMSRGSPGDDPRAVVFDWSAGADRFLEFGVIEKERDFTDDVYLTFRAGQGTQHPETIAEVGDLALTVTLRDGNGTTSAIGVSAFGGGVEEVYPRSNGWQNELEVVRIRLADFRHDGGSSGGGLDLSDVAAVRFDFGATFGAAAGRIALDDVALSKDAAPPITGGLSLSLPDGAPAIVAPGAPTEIAVLIEPGTEEVLSAHLLYRFAGGAFTAVALEPTEGDLYAATLPAAQCGDAPQFFFRAQGSLSGAVLLPPGAPAQLFGADVGVETVAFADDFETDQGWTVESEDLIGGAWERGDPMAGGDRGDPRDDFDRSGQCWVTGNTDGNADVDGGPTRLVSPIIDATGLADPRVRYARWFTNDDADADRLAVEISDDGGATWVLVEEAVDGPAWQLVTIRVADFVTPSAQVRLRFIATDNPNDSITEAGIDAVRVFSIDCP